MINSAYDYIRHSSHFSVFLTWFQVSAATNEFQKFVISFLKMKFSPAGKGLTPWLSFVMSNCDAVTFPLVSWVRCGA